MWFLKFDLKDMIMEAHRYLFWNKFIMTFFVVRHAVQNIADFTETGLIKCLLINQSCIGGKLCVEF